MPVMPQNWRAGGSSRRCRCRSRRAPGARPRPRRCRRTSRRGCGGVPGVAHGGGASKPTGATAEFSLAEPMANSSQLSLPRVTQPAWARRVTTVASNGRAVARQHPEPAVLGKSRVTKMSLCTQRHAFSAPARASGKARVGGCAPGPGWHLRSGPRRRPGAGGLGAGQEVGGSDGGNAAFAQFGGELGHAQVVQCGAG